MTNFTAYNEDCITGMQKHLADNSVDYTFFSPPFAALYTFSSDAEDLSNCESNEQFFEHYSFVAEQLHRVTKPGRNVSVHCINLPKHKSRYGVIGLYDFRGELVRRMEAAGFVYHAEVVIWKNPALAMMRTKSIGLLYKQTLKDSALSRMGLCDYIVTFRKDGTPQVPVTQKVDEWSVEKWEQVASPVWMDINESDTLNARTATEHDDEKHMTATQLTPIRRCIELWSNPGDTVLSPFMGIGSEGYEALRLRRKFIGFELKESYYSQARQNLINAESQLTLF